MSEQCAHDCAACGEDCPSRTAERADLREPCHELSNIKKVYAVISGKGGVGKSMVTSLLAAAAARAGKSVAVLDADVTGPSIPRAFGVCGHAQGDESGIYPLPSRTGVGVMSINLLLDNETDPVVWRGPMIAGVVKQFWTDVIYGDLDVLFIDMPPGTGDVPLTVFQTIPVDGVIIVTSPQELVGMIVEKAYNMARMMDIPITGVIENFSYIDCPDCKKRLYPFGHSDLDATAARLKIPVLARLPFEPAVAAAADAGKIESVVLEPVEQLAKKL